MYSVNFPLRCINHILAHTYMQKLLAALLLLTLVYGCHRDKLRALHFETVGGLVVADSADWKAGIMAYDTNRPWGLYPIYYIGPKTDTVGLGRKPVQGMWVYDWRDTCAYCAKWYTDTTITIRVYTTPKTAHTICYEQYPNTDWPVRTIDSVVSYLAYLVVIENISDSLIFIGESHFLLPNILQAKDDNGVWKDVERPIPIMCGAGLRRNYLEGGEILVAKMLKHTGNYKATCRLKFGRTSRIVYSNQFECVIDIRQLTDSLKKY
jgi:hypothetical protein